MHTLPLLAYAQDALEPHISAETISYHYGKHHQAYVTNLNTLIENTELANLPLMDIIKQSKNNPNLIGIFNNAAQVWNHTFFWDSLTPNYKAPSEMFMERIKSSFGDLDTFKQNFKQAALSQFGSGWVWLVESADGNLRILKTSNADLPLDDNPLLTCDVWEHAYYLDYQNKRADFVDVFLKHLINWDFAEKNLK